MKPKVIPKIYTGGLCLTFDPYFGIWDLAYRGINFIAYTAQFTLPRREDLDRILAELLALEPEMRQRITTRWQTYGDLPRTGEEYGVLLDDFASKGTYAVSWSGDDSWEDTGVEFQIRDQKIHAEDWAD